jgi:hypothetical protein
MAKERKVVKERKARKGLQIRDKHEQYIHDMLLYAARKLKRNKKQQLKQAYMIRIYGKLNSISWIFHVNTTGKYFDSYSTMCAMLIVLKFI